MSTRANIKFQDGDEYIHIDRSHDGSVDCLPQSNSEQS